jgi:hypothetical protein
MRLQKTALGNVVSDAPFGFSHISGQGQIICSYLPLAQLDPLNPARRWNLVEAVHLAMLRRTCLGP